MDDTAISIDMKDLPRANPPRRVANPDHGGDAVLARQDGAVREHAAALQHQAADEREREPPAWIGLPRDQDVAGRQAATIGDVRQYRRPSAHLPATGADAR